MINRCFRSAKVDFVSLRRTNEKCRASCETPWQIEISTSCKKNVRAENSSSATGILNLSFANYARNRRSSCENPRLLPGRERRRVNTGFRRFLFRFYENIVCSKISGEKNVAKTTSRTYKGTYRTLNRPIWMKFGVIVVFKKIFVPYSFLCYRRWLSILKG